MRQPELGKRLQRVMHLNVPHLTAKAITVDGLSKCLLSRCETRECRCRLQRVSRVDTKEGNMSLSNTSSWDKVIFTWVAPEIKIE